MTYAQRLHLHLGKEVTIFIREFAYNGKLLEADDETVVLDHPSGIQNIQIKNVTSFTHSGKTIEVGK
jgi:hypothetical protein